MRSHSLASNYRNSFHLREDPLPWCRSLDAEYQVVMSVVEHGSVAVMRSAGYAPYLAEETLLLVGS